MMFFKKLNDINRLCHLFTASILFFIILNRIIVLGNRFEIYIGISILSIILFLNLLMAFFDLKIEIFRRYFILFSLIVALIVWYLDFINYFFISYSTDSIIMSHMGAEMVLQGKNPYIMSLSPYIERYNLPPFLTTPKMDGTITDVITYPAFNFLFFVPFLAFGLDDLRWVLLLTHVLTLLGMYFFSPEKYRPTILIPMFLIPFILDFTPGSVTDIVWVFFIIMSIGLMFTNNRVIRTLETWFRSNFSLKKRNTGLNIILSGFFLGLAISFKQITWMMLPFLLIRLWHNTLEINYVDKLKHIVLFCLVIATPFFIFNVPFIINSPKIWFDAVLAPLFPQGAPMVPYGIGLQSMILSGITLPKNYFTWLTLTVTFLLIVVYYLYHEKVKFGMWLFLTIIPLFWWRSLPNYLIYWIPPMILDIVCSNDFEYNRLNTSNYLIKNRKNSLIFFLIFLITSSSIYTAKSLSSPEVSSIEFLNITPIQTKNINDINQMSVSIRNTGLVPIIPKFGISWKYVLRNLIYWKIIEGPTTLSPGKSAAYRISTEIPDYFLKDKDEISVIVNDAANFNIIKISEQLTIHINKTGRIMNGFFNYWGVNTQFGVKIPYSWFLIVKKSLGDTFQINNSIIKGKNSVMISVYQDGLVDANKFFGNFIEEEWVHTGIIQKISTLNQTYLSVFPTFNSSIGSIECGLRISDDQSHHLVILFSEIPEKKYLYNNYQSHQQLTLILPTKLNRWNHYSIDFLGNWTSNNWIIPEQIYFEAYIAANQMKPGNYSAYFSEIQ